MSAGRINLLIEQGADYERTIRVKDDQGAAVSLASAVIQGQIRKTFSAREVLASFTCAVVSAASGEFTIALTAAQTAAIPVNPAIDEHRKNTNYTYDIEVYTAAIGKVRLLEGVAEISPEVTR